MLESVRRAVEGTRRVRELARIGAAARTMARAEGADRERAERALAGLMADARGLPMKVGQFLSDGGDREGFRPLVEGVEPELLCDLRPAIERSLGAPIASIFSRFDESQAAASLGQVHRAELHDGTVVAVKVRYPGMPSAVETVLRLAGLLPGIGPIRKWGFDLESYRQLLTNDLERELDYRSEATRQTRFRAGLEMRGLVIPGVFPDLCCEDLLVQTWEEGSPLSEFAARTVEERQQLGRILVKSLFRSLFVLGEVHADPHPGNLKVRHSASGQPEVVLLDFGCTVVISRESRLSLLKLILAARGEGPDVAPLQAYSAMGFDVEKLVAIAASLPALTSLLLQPFRTDELLNLDTWNLGSRLERLLGDHRWWFRAAGPPESLLLLRAFHGLMIQLRTLKVALPWWPLLLESVDEFVFEEARQLELPELPAEVGAKARSLGALAKSLRVRVLVGGREKADVKMPAEAALNLRVIVPEDVLAWLAASSIELDAIEDRVRANGIAPQEILSINDGDKQIDVWLE
jgi:hypothetical protein